MRSNVVCTCMYIQYCIWHYTTVLPISEHCPPPPITRASHGLLVNLLHLKVRKLDLTWQNLFIIELNVPLFYKFSGLYRNRNGRPCLKYSLTQCSTMQLWGHQFQNSASPDAVNLIFFTSLLWNSIVCKNNESLTIPHYEQCQTPCLSGG